MGQHIVQEVLEIGRRVQVECVLVGGDTDTDYVGEVGVVQEIILVGSMDCPLYSVRFGPDDFDSYWFEELVVRG